MVDAVVGVLIENLIDGLLNEGREVLEFHNQFKKMKRELPYMQSLLKDADKVRIKDQKKTLKTVARDLRELIYEAEGIIEDCELFLEQKQKRGEFKSMNYFSLSSLKYRYQMGKRLSQINQEIGDLRERMKSYLPLTQSLSNEEQAGSSRPIRYPILMNDAEIVGLEDDVRKIKRWIMEACAPLHVIGIVGMGGIGKTTLTEKIKNYDEVKKSYEHVLFVTVSQTFKFDELLKKMLKKLDVDDTKLLNIDVRDLLEELRKRLEGNRYLIILDDVWRTDWWESFKSALPQTNMGGCIVVTTRIEKVARSMGALENDIHQPKLLSNGDDWSLFSKIAFANNGGLCRNPKIEQIGRELVVKCKGLPLAIKVMGGVMLGKGDSTHEWRDILEHLKEEMAAHDEQIFAPLQLSYEELPMHLKPCMLSFAAFPEDYVILAANVIKWWIGEGFIRGRDGKTAFEIGLECFNELISRGLLLGVWKDYYEQRFITCKVHDMIRDMIINIAKDEDFMGLDNRGMLSCTDRSRRMGIVNSQMNQINSQLLRTVIGVDLEENEKEFALNVGPKFCKLKWLRVLHVEFKSVRRYGRGPLKMNWLNGIGSLIHLICLTIICSALEELPNSIEKLKNLQVLRLSEFPYLKRLPRQVTTLERLTMLDLEDCDRLEYVPKGVGKLSNLESLMGFKILNSNVEDACHLSDLKMLIRLRRLELLICTKDQLTEGELTVLSELKQLEFLALDFVRASGEIITKVDYKLPPLQKLRELRFWRYKGEKTPVWINPTTFPNLRRLFIWAGDMTRMSREFFENNNIVWDLEILVLKFLPKLKVDWREMKKAMPSLRKLKVDSCDELESAPWSNDGWLEEGRKEHIYIYIRKKVRRGGEEIIEDALADVEED